MKNDILRLLSKNARFTADEIAKRLDADAAEVQKIIEELEEGNVIRGYQAVIDESLLPESKVKAINIYELVHKCKEWAYRYGYEIASYKLQDIHNKPYRCILAHNNLQLNRDMRYGFYADTEPDSIFLGCEYILEKIK